MRLGIEARALRGVRTGIGNWTSNLLRELPRPIQELEVFLYLPQGFVCRPPPELANANTPPNMAFVRRVGRSPCSVRRRGFDYWEEGQGSRDG